MHLNWYFLCLFILAPFTLQFRIFCSDRIGSDESVLTVHIRNVYFLIFILSKSAQGNIPHMGNVSLHYLVAGRMFFPGLFESILCEWNEFFCSSTECSLYCRRARLLFWRSTLQTLRTATMICTQVL